jgi:hypothetical protein
MTARDARIERIRAATFDSLPWTTAAQGIDWQREQIDTVLGAVEMAVEERYSTSKTALAMPADRSLEGHSRKNPYTVSVNFWLMRSGENS